MIYEEAHAVLEPTMNIRAVDGRIVLAEELHNRFVISGLSPSDMWRLSAAAAEAAEQMRTAAVPA